MRKVEKHLFKRSAAFVMLIAVIASVLFPFYSAMADPVIPQPYDPKPETVKPGEYKPNPTLPKGDPANPNSSGSNSQPATSGGQGGNGSGGNGGTNSSNSPQAWDDALWYKTLKFTVKDLGMGYASFIDAVRTNGFSWKDFYFNRAGIARGILNFIPGEAGQWAGLVGDTWDGVDKGIQTYAQYQNFRHVQSLVRGSQAVRDLGQVADQALSYSQAVGQAGYALTKLGKGLAIADIAISGGETIFHTYKAFTTDGQESTDYAFKALASGGSALFSAGVLVGPTPVGVGLMVVGGIAWGIGTIYKHRDTIKKVANKAKDAVKSAWNTVKGWFS
ncbi:hypothetical protein [Planifilum fimeticola]